MSRTLATLIVAVLTAGTPAVAQNRYLFGFTHTDDGTAADAVQLVTDRGAIAASGRGWFDDTGFHHGLNDNYVAGALDGQWYRNFFLFDLSGWTEGFSRATLRVSNPSVWLPWCAPVACDGFSSPNPTELFFLRFLDPTHYGALVGTSSGRRDVFDALGGGDPVGSHLATAADNGQWIEIELNAAGLADLNRRAGSTWALGGSLDDGVRRVETTVAPEPSTWVLFATGLLGMALVARRRRGQAPVRAFSFSQESRSVTVRLKTRAPGRESISSDTK